MVSHSLRHRDKSEKKMMVHLKSQLEADILVRQAPEHACGGYINQVHRGQEMHLSWGAPFPRLRSWIT